MIVTTLLLVRSGRETIAEVEATDVEALRSLLLLAAESGKAVTSVTIHSTNTGENYNGCNNHLH